MSKTIIKIAEFRNDNIPAVLRESTQWARCMMVDGSEKKKGYAKRAFTKNMGWMSVTKDTEVNDIVAEGEDCLEWNRVVVLLKNEDGSPKMAYLEDGSPRLHKGKHLQQFTYRLVNVNDKEEQGSVLDVVLSAQEGEQFTTEREEAIVAAKMEGVPT